MFKKLLSFSVALVLLCNISDAQVYSWAYTAGGNGWDDVKSTHLGNDNGTVVTGMFSNTAMFGATSLTSQAYQDAFVAKYDQMGTMLWAHAISGDEQDWGYKITTDNSNNVYVTGYFQSTAIHFTPNDSLVKSALSSRNVFTAKYSSTGVFQWARLGSAGNTNGYLTSHCIVADNLGNVIVSGDYNKTIEFSGNLLPATNATNIFMVKYDPNGNVLWTKAGVSTAICWFTDLTTDASNNIFATGKISKPITFGPTTIPNILGDDMVIGKFDQAGNLTWMQVLGKPILSSTTDNNFDCGVGIKVDGSGNVFVGGALIDTTYYDANLNMLIVKQFAAITKYSSTGTQLWLKKFGNDAKDVINAIDLDANGNVYAIGNYKDVFSVGGVTLPQVNTVAAFVAKFNSSDGSTAFAYRHGTSGQDVNGYGIGINQQNGNVYTSGNYNGTCVFNANSLTSVGSWDIYMVLLNNNVASALQDQDNNEGVKIYPNPAGDHIHIRWENMAQAASRYSIYSINGSIKQQGTIASGNSIDLSNLMPGNYILSLENNQTGIKKYFTKK